MAPPIGIPSKNPIYLTLREKGFISCDTFGAGKGGNITVTAKGLELDKGTITAKSKGTGNAGTVRLNIDTLSLDNSAITTQADQAGGGDIFIQNNTRLDLVNSTISAKAQGIEAHHHGGNLTIRYPRLFTLDNSELRADAKRGRGGNIDIHTNQILSLGTNVIDASSELGLNGRLIINDIDISNNIIPLSINYLEAESWLPKRCAKRLGTDVSRFVVTGTDILPEAPHALSVHIPSKLLNTLVDEPSEVSDSNPFTLDSQKGGLSIGCRPF